MLVGFEDMLRTTRMTVEVCAAVGKDENVLIATDLNKVGIAEVFARASREVDAETVTSVMSPREMHGNEPPRIVAAAMKAADVILAPTTYSMTHTDARRAACKNGGRGATLPNITEDTMKRTLRADYKEIEKRTKQMAAMIKGAKEARVVTELGTDITMSLARRIVKEDTGIISERGSSTNLPAGEAYLAPVEGTAKGTIVADGSCAGIGVIREPIRIKVADGYATDISGGDEATALINLISPFGQDGRNIAELGIGTNDKAQLSGSTLEDEKVMGTVHVALGDNSTFGGKCKAGIHIDGIINKPTLIADDRLIMENGKLMV